MKTKFYWHIHHDILLEPLTDSLKNRIDYIKEHKPKEEQALRLKLLKPVKGKLPAGFVKAGEAYVKAEKAYGEAEKAYVKAWEFYDKAWEVCGKAREAYAKAREAYVKVRKAYDKQINDFHKKECPNCPWDGETIFPNPK